MKSSAVDFRYLVPPTGIKPVTSFQDSFVRADQPFFMGDDWYFAPTVNSTTAPSDIAGVVNVSANIMTIGGGILNLNGAASVFIPATISVPQVRTKSQQTGLFAEIKLTTRTAGVDCLCGPGVFMNPNSTQCYFLEIQSAGAGTVRVDRNVGATLTRLVDPVGAFVIGDVWRLEVVLGVAGNTLQTFQNGVLVNTFVDNSASRLVGGGLFGFAFDGCFTGQLGFNNFSAGVL